jgi:hypothetical protein
MYVAIGSRALSELHAAPRFTSSCAEMISTSASAAFTQFEFVAAHFAFSTLLSWLALANSTAKILKYSERRAISSPSLLTI